MPEPSSSSLAAALAGAPDRSLDAALHVALLGEDVKRWAFVNDSLYSPYCSPEHLATLIYGDVYRLDWGAVSESGEIEEAVPCYSTDASAALSVVEAMGTHPSGPWDWGGEHYVERVWLSAFVRRGGDANPAEITATTFPRAICEAAILALHAADSLPAPALALLGARTD